MSGDLDNSQAVRDAQRADADLQRAMRAGATSDELRALEAVKASAEERVVMLRRRIEPVPPPDRRQRRRAEVRAEMNDPSSHEPSRPEPQP